MKYIPTILLIALVFPSCMALQKEQKPKQYEYKIEFINDYTWSSEMNSQGREGWQVVGSRRASSSSTDDYGYEIIFMREIHS